MGHEDGGHRLGSGQRVLTPVYAAEGTGRAKEGASGGLWAPHLRAHAWHAVCPLCRGRRELCAQGKDTTVGVVCTAAGKPRHIFVTGIKT